ncbi:hypothetical protein [Peteryoungia ipomoeae]|uniref:Uncharacterized protein n=1 Tax=Peteryoungia ipomoeae TaxID=1210932 RepID=A0A4S8NZM4_9HYPH|nr:hypothetical protein [Peteryoungia ipomoeae]THV23078.1 hypothetical protein FAA97_10715 [Peteryoungia ipomoeae]
MKKQKQTRRKAAQRSPAGTLAKPAASAGDRALQTQTAFAAAGSERVPGRAEAAALRFRTGAKTLEFRLAFAVFLAGIAAVVASLVVQHEYAFFELGYLFTLSIYDLVLALLGLSVCIGMAEMRRDIGLILAGFLGVLVPMLLAFDAVFQMILKSPLGEVLYLIAPAAVLSSGAVLWLPAWCRRFAAPVSAAVIALSLALFIGLDDFGIGIGAFATSAVLSALWFLLVPGLMLRPFRGVWLIIPARIIGSWLLVISIIETAALYAPPGEAPPPPTPSITDQEGTLMPLDPAVREGLADAPDLFGEAPPPDAASDDPLALPETGELPADRSPAARSVTPPAFP